MIIDILPFRLQLASLQKADIPRCTHQLMKLVLFPSGPQHFFSYTETDKEVSLILDESHLSGFPENTLNVCPVIWRAVQIEPGESGLGTVEVVSQVSKPLADIDVSIMQISTYDADFTLLPECDLERALECLSSIFSISNNPLEDVGLQSGDLQTWEKSYPMSPSGVNSLQDALSLNPRVRDRQLSVGTDSGIASAAATAPNSDASSHPGKNNEPSDLVDPALISSLSLNDPDQEPICSRENVVRARHPFKVNYPHRLHITSMEESLMDMLAIRLLESIFFDNRTDRFFSFTQTDTTMSIIMDDATMSLFPDHTLNTHAGDWRLISIGDGPLGFDECGIVSEFSRPLSEHGIGLFYLSTFSSDYLMVNDQDFDQAVSCLEETARIAAIDSPRTYSHTEAQAHSQPHPQESDESHDTTTDKHTEDDAHSIHSHSDSDSSEDETEGEYDESEESSIIHDHNKHEGDLEIVFMDERGS
ncbi:GATS protein-like 3 [Podila verticillata]|nr:GATS protein-like 3 [Podila verticillata]